MIDLQQQLAQLSPEKQKLLAQLLRNKSRNVDSYPLSSAQQRLWFLDKLEPNNPLYNLFAAFRLQGTLDTVVLAESLQEIIRRHKVLRTTFVEIDGQPVQVIAPSHSNGTSVPLPLIDLHDTPASAQDDRVLQLAHEEALRPFDLARGPLFRTTVLRLNPQEHILFLAMHHSITDGWSVGVFFKELAALYSAFSQGLPSPLPELPVQYVDYARWQHEWLRSEEYNRQAEYWKRQFSDTPPVLALPTDRPRPLLQSFRGAIKTFSLPRVLSESLKAISQREGVTLFMTLLAAFNVLLYRYSGQDDIVVGTPIANRNQVEVEGLIGCFVNMLALRTNLAANRPFRELLYQVRETALTAYHHQDLPFEKLVEILQLKRDLSHAPLFQVIFALQNAPTKALELSGLTISMLEIDNGMAELDLLLSLEETPQGLIGLLEYNTDLFDATTITAMIGHFQSILESAVSALDQPISELSLLSAAERQQLLGAWNATAREYPTHVCLHDIFAAQVRRTPDTIAVLFGRDQGLEVRGQEDTEIEDRGSRIEDRRSRIFHPRSSILHPQSLTYEELDQRANRLAHHLRRLGVGPEALVGLCVERSLELVIGLLGILKAGAAYLPLDPSYPAERLAFMLEDAQVAVLLTTNGVRSQSKIQNPKSKIVDLDADWPIIAQAPQDAPISGATPQNLAYVIYTSGSTGRPKGTLVSHANVARLFAATRDQLGFDTRDVWTLFHSFAFDFSVWELWGALAYGGRLVVVPYWVSRSPEAFRELLHAERVTVLNQTPSAFRQLAQAGADAADAEGLALRLVVFGGEALAPRDLAPWIARYGDQRPRLVNMYGITETTVHVTYRPLSKDDPGRAAASPIGQPLADLQVYVLDEQLRPQPIGVPGELYVGGAGLARGYLNRPELTAERFLPNPFAQGMGDGGWGMGDGGLVPHPSPPPALRLSPIPRLYRTGDRARYRADGEIEYLGRIDQQVKLRGFRIELGEIEAVLRQHPFVREGVVLAREDVPGEKRLVAYIVPTIEDRGLKIEDSGSSVRDPLSSIFYPLSSELRAFLHERLPDYMVPSAFVVLERLLLSPNGKLDRKALPAPERVELEDDYVAPRKPLEHVLAEIWSSVLKIKHIGIYNTFLSLGGDSILGIQVVQRARQVGIRLTAKDLFEHPTIAELATLISRSPASTDAQAAVTLVPMLDFSTDLNIEDAYPLSPMQQGMLVHSLYAESAGTYLEQMRLVLPGSLNIAAFIQAWKQVLARHPILRTAFAWAEGTEVRQVVWRDVDLPLEEFDWRELPADEQEARLSAYIQDVRRGHGFDLARPPLMRLALFQLHPVVMECVWSYHQLLLDGWSHTLLLDEVQACYTALNQQQAFDWPERRPYREYITWVHSQDMRQAEAFWRAQLEGFTMPTPLGIDLPTEGGKLQPVESYGQQTAAFARATFAELHTLVRRHQLTLNTLIQGAWAVLLSRYSGMDDVLFGNVMSGRSAPLGGVERMVGLLINTLPVRVRVASSLSLLSWLLELQAQQVAAREYEYSPLSHVQRWSDVPPDARLFDSVLVFGNFPEGAVDSWPCVNCSPLQTGYPLHVSVKPGTTLTTTVTYDARRFDDASIERLLGHFHTLFSQIAAQPTQPLATLTLLTPAEQQQLLVDFNRTAPLPDLSLSIIGCFETQVDMRPHDTAVSCGSEQLTYAELDRRANQLSRCFAAHGLRHGDQIGLFGERGIAMLVTILASYKLGACYVPLDPAHPDGRIATILAATNIRLLATQSSLVERSHELVRALSTPPLVFCWDATSDSPAVLNQRIVAQFSHNRQPSAYSPYDPANIFFTSGSTGTPKGVIVEQIGMLNHLRAKIQLLELSSTSIVAQNASHCFDISVWQYLAALLAGGQVIIYDDDTAHNPLGLLRAIQRDNVTVLETVPTMLEAMLQVLDDDAAATDFTLPALHYLISNAETLPVPLCRRWFKRFPTIPLINTYGATECSDDTTHQILREPPSTTATLVPVGTPIPNFRIYVLDRHLHPVPLGCPGQIAMAGIGVGQGYLGDPAGTACTFVANPFPHSDGRRLYLTGDMGRWNAAGQFEFLGRLDHQVKVRGYRVELEEIESVLHQFEGVRDAVVVAHEARPGRAQLAGYVVLQTGITRDAVRTYLRSRLPDYMVPSALIELAALPLTVNGKVDRQALPPPELERDAATHTAPRSLVEERLAQIWAEVLGVSQVGIHDNFFELGGDSILSIQVVARAHQVQLHITPKQIFQHQTIADLAQVAVLTAATPVDQSLVTGVVSLTPIQHLFFEHSLHNRHHWNNAVLLKSRASLVPALLEQALRRLLEHHDALRLRFSQDQAGWHQHITAPDGTIALSIVDLGGKTEAEQYQTIAETETTLQTGLNIEHGPLLRAALFRDGARADRLLLVIHHLVIDGISWRVLLEDLQTAYTQLRDVGAIQLPPKTNSYQQWAERLQTYAQHGELRRELENYWLAERYRTARPLPVDLHEGANTIASERIVTVSLSVEETRALLQEVPAAYHTQINDVLLTALAQALAEWTGQPHVLVQLEGHGREALFDDLDTSRTIGWFTSTFPVLLELASSAEPGAALKAIKEQLRAIPQRGIGYGVLRYLSDDPQVRASLAALPAPEISFNYLGQFDQTISLGELFSAVEEPTGAASSPRNHRQHLLDINGSVIGGQLKIHWGYSIAQHHHTTIEGLAQAFVAALRALILHCRSAQAGGYTPSDFPLARLTQAQLDTLFGTSRAIEAVYPLTPLQQGLLFHTIYAPTAGDYLGHVRTRLHGPLQLEAFIQAWQQLLNRHTILRTAFVWAGLAEAHQVVWHQVVLPVTQHDWRGQAPDVQERHLHEFLQADRAQGFDLLRPPLMRIATIRYTDQDYELIWTTHHLIMDGWSQSPLVRDMFAIYEALIAGRPAQLPPVRPYQEYIAWLQRQDTAAAETFWRTTLAGFSAPTLLGIDAGVRSANDGQHHYDKHTLHLSATTTQALQQFAREEHLTLNTLMQAAWALLLSHYSGEHDVVFGTTLSGRPADLPGVESMVGVFVNTLPVRVRVPPRADLRAWLHELQSWQTELHQYEHTPLVQIQGWSDIPRGTPLFESLLVFQNYPLDTSVLQSESGLALMDVRTYYRATYPLSLMVEPDQQLTLVLMYECGRFDDTTGVQLLGHLEMLLNAMLVDPTQQIAALPMISPHDRQRMLIDWNATAAPFPTDACIQQLFEAQAARIPDAPALVFEQHHLSYAELNARANQLAHHLQGFGVGPDVLVALCVERSLELLIGLLGILKAGGAYVPLDPAYPAERLAFMLADCQAPIMVTQDRLVDRLPSFWGPVICLDADWAVIGNQPAECPVTTAYPDNAAYVIYTSGSTGRPKGTLLSHRGLCNVSEAQLHTLGTGEGTRMLQFASFSFDASIFESVMAWRAGAALYLPNADARIPGPALADFLAKSAITTVTLPPTALLALGESHLPALRTICVAGEACPAELVARWMPGRRFFNLYGPTETTIWATAHECDDRRAAPPIGRPIANMQVFVLDPYLRPVPVGVAGELHIGGVGLARGYLGRADLTAERFIPNPFAGGMGDKRSAGGGLEWGMGNESSIPYPPCPIPRLYRTGDRVRLLANGSIEFLSRVDHQVKLRGFRIELGEIETILAQHPALRTAVVVAREDVPGDVRLVAYVVLTNDQRPTTGEQQDELGQSSFVFRRSSFVDELRDFLKERLPDYMLPAVFVVLPELPLNANGKVERRALPAPDQARAHLGHPFVPPRDSLECRLAQVWEEVLGIHPVGATDSFFDLGGHSILAVRLMFEVSEVAGRELPLATLFQAPTVERLAHVIRSQEDAPWSPLVAIQPNGSLPPLFCVHAHGGGALSYYELARQLGPDQPFYGLQAPGLGGEQEALTDIGEMARLYIAAMRQVQPEGPYRLGGHSFGGLVVYEMAQQLRAQGQEIALLAIFDTPAPVPGNLPHDPSEMADASDLATSLIDIARLVSRISLRDVPLTLDELRPLDSEAQLQLMFNKLKAFGFFPAETEIKSMRGLLDVHQINAQITWRYFTQAQPLAQPLTLFIAENPTTEDYHSKPHDLATDPTLGWSTLVGDRVECYLVPGDHISLMTRPHVETLAARLKICLAALHPEIVA